MRLKLLLSAILVFIPTIQAVCKKCGEEEDVILNCYGKSFRCINETNYYLCSDFGPVSLAFSSQKIQVCPIGMICSSANNYECVLPSESSTTTECPPEESDVTTTLGSISTRGVNYTTEITFTVSTKTTPPNEDTSDTSSIPSTPSTASSDSPSETTAGGSSGSSSATKPTEWSTESTPGGPTKTTTGSSSGSSSATEPTKWSTENTPGGPSETTTGSSSGSSSATEPTQWSTESTPGGPTETITGSSSGSSSATEPTKWSTESTPGGPSETTTGSSSGSSSATEPTKWSTESTPGGPTETTTGSSSGSSSATEPTKWSTESTPGGPSETTTGSSSGSSSATEPTKWSTESTPGGPTETTTGSSSTTTSSPAVFKCSGEGKYPDTTDCSKYHICIYVGGAYFELEGVCPKETRFDPYNSICTTSPVQCPGERTLNCTSEGTFAHPNKCNRYYSCHWNYLYDKYIQKQYLCAANQEYSETSETCVTAVDCVPDQSDEFTCRDVGSYPVDYNCSDFYYCELASNNTLTKTVKSCGDTALFDRARKKCRKACLVTNCPFNDVDIQ